MRSAVRDAFVGFSAPLEGVVDHFYADIKGLVTIGIGNLVDPISTALNLPLRYADGSLAPKEEVMAEWLRVKNDPRCATVGHRYAARLTRLRLDAEGIDQVVGGRLDLNESILVKRFPNFEEWPADAQLATHSMAWACGPAFRFSRLEAALRVLDFATAAVECKMNEKGNPGLIPRNGRNRILYSNADLVETHDMDPEVLYWPRDLATELPPEAA